MRLSRTAIALVVVAACSSTTPPPETAEPGVVFTYPVDGEVDVPSGTNIVVAFSDPVDGSAIGECNGSAGAFCLVGPDGAVAATPILGSDGTTVQLAGPVLADGATYQLFVSPAVMPGAQNLPESGPLVTFTARSLRPRAAPPALIAVNGGNPAAPESFRPMLDTSTIRLVFSEPLDPRTVALAPGSIQLLDPAGAEVPAAIYAEGIHVSIDPASDLTANKVYMLELGAGILDTGGQALAPTVVELTARDTKGASGPIAEVLRTRQAGDPGEPSPRLGDVPNTVSIASPLIGAQASQLAPTTLAAELSDPQALDGPIAFTIPRGQTLSASGLAVALGGAVPLGVSTGDIEMQLLTDAGGRIYRNPHQPITQSPDDDRAPLYVDLTMDVAIYATDPTGNAVLAQTVLGVQAAGVAIATDGVLDIESVGSLDLNLLGAAEAPANLGLELISDASAAAPAPDTTPPALLATYPAGSDAFPVDGGAELVFDEPIDLGSASIAIEDGSGSAVPAALESYGSVVVVRPFAPLAYSASYQLVASQIADLAGNAAGPLAPIPFTTPDLVATDAPMTIAAAHPGVACALVGATAASPGRCAGGSDTDDLYEPFVLPAGEAIAVDFTQPIDPASVALGSACGSGDVRVEIVDATGACTGVVPGTLARGDRDLAFAPDAPWTEGTRYRLTLASGSATACGAGLCGIASAASFDPLDGTAGSNAGGPDAAFTFTGGSAATATFLAILATPVTDVNGNGLFDAGETATAVNRVELSMAGSGGGTISDAAFTGSDCDPAMPGTQACIYITGAMFSELEPAQQSCVLPDGTTATSCVPIAIAAEAMYGTSIGMSATAAGAIPITTTTGTSVMRIREPAGGYIVTVNGQPTLVASLDLYMDAPDMQLPDGATHDLHSKALTVPLSGPLTALPDGRIAITASNTADVPITVNIDAPIAGPGQVDMVIPAGTMQLRLVSPSR